MTRLERIYAKFFYALIFLVVALAAVMFISAALQHGTLLDAKKLFGPSLLAFAGRVILGKLPPAWGTVLAEWLTKHRMNRFLFDATLYGVFLLIVPYLFGWRSPGIGYFVIYWTGFVVYGQFLYKHSGQIETRPE